MPGQQYIERGRVPPGERLGGNPVGFACREP